MNNLSNKKLIRAKVALVSFLITGNFSFAAELQGNNVNSNSNIPSGTHEGSYNGAFLSVGNGAMATIGGDLSYDVKEVGDGETRVDVTNGNLVTENKLSIKIAPNTGNKFTRPKGIIIRGSSDSKIENLDVDVALASEEDVDRGSADSNAAYGVAVGYDYNGGSSNDTARLTVNNANISVSNTANTVHGNKTATYFITAKVVFGHQLSGLKVYKKGGAIPEFISNGNVNINVEDKSTAKSGDYLVGVYASGKDAKVIFNGNTNIRVAANGINSAGIKIGKPVEGEGGATVTANGKLVVDTTETKDSAAVRLFAKNSKLLVTGTKTDDASEIKSANSAIVFDTQDYKTKFTLGETSRNENAINPEVELKNTILTTTSSTSSLIKAKAEKVTDITFGLASRLSRGQLNSGSFRVENAKFTLKGDKSLATAADNGWLIEVQGQRNNDSSLTANIEEKAHIVGLTHKEHSSSLIMNIDNAKWELKKKGDTTTSTVNTIHLKNEAILDASSITAPNKAEYTIKLTSDGTKADGTLTNAGTINLVNNSYEDVLTIEGKYVGQDGKIKMNTEWNGPADELGGNSKSDLIHIKGTASGSTTILPVKIDGTENVLDGSIGDIASDLGKRTVPVVKVDDSTNYSPNFFIGKAKTTGAGEIQLSENKKDDGSIEYFWTLTALNSKDPNQPILSQPTSSYVQVPKANMDLAYNTLRTLHERKGENQTLTWEHFNKSQKVADGQVWVRLLGNRALDYGKHRFNMETQNKGIQLGKEFSITRDDEGKHILKGAYLSYQESRLSFKDRYRAENAVVVDDKYTGSGKTKAFSLGLTRTSYTQEGAYLDLVGQLTLLNNKYYSRDNTSAKNKAWGIALSAEYGKPYEFNKNIEENTSWLFEPQVQLIYQYMHFGSFYDGYKNIKQDAHHNLKGRLGFRLAYNDYEVKERKASVTWYGLGNVWHNFTNRYETKIGKDIISEQYAKTLGELGMGVQIPVAEKSYLYADFRYARAFGKVKFKEYRGSVGLRYTF